MMGQSCQKKVQNHTRKVILSTGQTEVSAISVLGFAIPRLQ